MLGLCSGTAKIDSVLVREGAPLHLFLCITGLILMPWMAGPSYHAHMKYLQGSLKNEYIVY